MRLLRIVVAFFVLSSLVRCSNDNDIDATECGVDVVFDGSSISYCTNDSTETLDRIQDEFIWQAMNLFYYYQSEVESLDDDEFTTYNELTDYVNSFDSSEDLFNNGLLSSNDRFSWIVDDYVELENSFQGITTSFGYNFRLLRESEGSSKIFGYVEYVANNGPANQAGMKRGDLFNKIDGIPLTIDNYAELLFSSNSYELTLATMQDEMIISTQTKITLTAVELIENPIFLHKVIDLSGMKIGYLVYNQFVNNNEAHRELNQVFRAFKNEGITDLIVDLRYNPGGSVTTTRLLASMIYGNASSSDIFGSIVYNDKLAEYFDSPFSFFEALPVFNENGDLASEETLIRLTNLSRVFVITSGSTASASELLIAGLSSYLNVETIGTTTVGKNEGSVTLYDSKATLFLRTESAELNEEHTYAIQPIVSRLANSEGFSDYSEGLQPDITIDEKDYLGQLAELGDLDEPLLSETLSVITGSLARKPIAVGVVKPAFNYENPKKLRLQKALLDLRQTN